MLDMGLVDGQGICWDPFTDLDWLSSNNMIDPVLPSFLSGPLPQDEGLNLNAPGLSMSGRESSGGRIGAADAGASPSAVNDPPGDSVMPSLDQQFQRQEGPTSPNQSSHPSATGSPAAFVTSLNSDAVAESDSPQALYATSTNGARAPCTKVVDRCSIVMHEVTPLPLILDQGPDLNDQDVHAGFPDLGHITHRLTSAPMLSWRLTPEMYDYIVSQFHLLCQDGCEFFQPYHSAAFPSLDHLNLFAQLYMSNVNHILPLLRAEQDSLNDHWLLLLALCAVGSQYTQTNEFSQCVWPLHEFVRRGLAVETERLGTNLESMSLSLAQALVVSQFGLLYCGSEQLRRQATARHALLVEVLKSMHLLGSESRDRALSGDDVSVEVMWKHWLEVEMRRRLGYGIWV